jgi:hypothetical protein
MIGIRWLMETNIQWSDFPQRKKATKVEVVHLSNQQQHVRSAPFAASCTAK